MQHVPVDVCPPLSRRTALSVAVNGTVSVVAATAFSGCTAHNPLEDRPATEPAPVDPDVALRDSARRAIAAQLATVLAVAGTTGSTTGNTTGRPTLVRRLAPLASMHSAHLAALPGEETSRAVPTKPPATLADVLAGERALNEQLAGMAQRAESGGFARLLASMAAAIGQTLTVTQ